VASTSRRMFPRRLLISLVPVAAFAVGCPDRQPAEPAPPAAPQIEAPAAPVRPERLEVTVLGHIPDGGTVLLELAENERPLVPPLQALELVGNLPLTNYRVRVFDEVDRALVSDDTAESLDGGFRYQIDLPEPLRTGHRYVLSIDAETGNDVEDAWGRHHPEWRRNFQVEGERQRPAPPPPQPGKKRRR
jgi:hypothetical protein